jgi:AcrR family transcriptional regulator
MSMSPRASSREAILNAAAVVVREQGAAHLTLDAVSARAKVSKGGLLYHFRSKEALLQGMTAGLREMVLAARRMEAAKLPDSPARELKAHIRAMGVVRNSKVAGIAAALLAAGTENPKLLAPVEEYRRGLAAELSSHGISREFVAVVSLALEGLWLLELLGASKLSAKEQRAITAELLRLVKEEESRSPG